MFEKTKLTKSIVKRFGFEQFEITVIEAGIEAPAQLIFQIYIAFRGIRPGKCLSFKVKNKILGYFYLIENMSSG